MSYPLRIRFWYVVHNYAERLWHWVWFAKLQPWHRSQEIQVPPSYRLVDEREATEAERGKGIDKVRTYIGVGGYGETPPVRYEGSYQYKVAFVGKPEAPR